MGNRYTVPEIPTYCPGPFQDCVGAMIKGGVSYTSTAHFFKLGLMETMQIEQWVRASDEKESAHVS